MALRILMIPCKLHDYYPSDKYRPKKGRVEVVHQPCAVLRAEYLLGSEAILAARSPSDRMRGLASEEGRMTLLKWLNCEGLLQDYVK